VLTAYHAGQVDTNGGRAAGGVWKGQQHLLFSGVDLLQHSFRFPLEIMRIQWFPEFFVNIMDRS